MLELIPDVWVRWTIGIILMIIAIYIAYETYKHQRQVVKLVCILSEPVSLVSVRQEVRDKIKIYYEGREVKNLTTLKIMLKNIGTIPIRREHIVKPIKFSFNKNSEIIDYNVVSTTPENIDVELSKEDKNTITCCFDLLNPKESVTLQFVFLGNPEKPDISARIEGLSYIECLTEDEAIRAPILGKELIIFGFGYILSAIIFVAISQTGLYKFIREHRIYIPELDEPIMFSIFCSIFGTLLIILGLIAPKTYKKYKKFYDKFFNFLIPRK